MKPQYILLIFFALFITGLADGIEAGMVGIGAAPAAVPIIGTLIAGATGPLGILIGIAASCCINITMGTGLLFLLIYNRMFYLQYVFPGFIAETIPGINVLPFWVLVVVLCIMKKTAEEGAGVLAVVSKAAAVAVLVGSNPATSLGAAKTLNTMRTQGLLPESAQGAKEEGAPRANRAPLQLKSPRMSGDIRYVPKTA